MSKRFEESISIMLVCCLRRMTRLGNLSLRDARGSETRLAYECGSCFRRVSVCDGWYPEKDIDPAVRLAHDIEE